MTICQKVLLDGLYWQTGLIDPPGMILNGLCVICFAQILWNRSDESSTASNKTNMFKFLFVKAVCDFTLQTVDIFALLNLCGTQCHLYATPFYPIWQAYFYWGIEFTLTTMSPLMEVAATLVKN
jgi:hypothetical protein